MRSFPRATTAAFAALIGVLALAGPARATPQDLFGYGARSPGLGLTGVSFADDYEATYLNPAGLSRARARTIVLGLSAGVFELAVDGERYAAHPSTGMNIGFTLPIPFGPPLENRLVLGGAFFTPSSVLLDAIIPAPGEPQFNVLERAQAAAIMVGLGIDLRGLVDGLRLGGAVSVAADLVGNLFVRLDETSAFVSTVETKLVAGYSPIFGISYERERWGVGVSYRFELSGEVALDITAANLPVEVPALRVGGVVEYDPPTVAAEGFFFPTEAVRVVLGLETSIWDDYPGPQTQVTATSTQSPAPEYSTTVSPRLAVEGTLDDGEIAVELRAGYAFEPSPAGPARLAPMRDAGGNPTTELVPLRYLDNNRHVFTLGVGLTHELEGGVVLSFDGFAQLHALEPRTHEIGAIDGAPPMKSSGLVLAGGWTLSLGFR